MKRLLLAARSAVGWGALGVAGTVPVSGVAPRASCAGLPGLTLPNAQILSATQKSGYCNVIGIINKRTSTQDTDHFTYGIGFALNLPNTWHGRFEMMGGGGTDGSLRSDPTGAAHHLETAVPGVGKVECKAHRSEKHTSEPQSPDHL